MALRLVFLMAIAMLGNLDDPSLGASYGCCYAWDLGWLFV